MGNRPSSSLSSSSSHIVVPNQTKELIHERKLSSSLPPGAATVATTVTSTTTSTTTSSSLTVPSVDTHTHNNNTDHCHCCNDESNNENVDARVAVASPPTSSNRSRLDSINSNDASSASSNALTMTSATTETEEEECHDDGDGCPNDLDSNNDDDDGETSLSEFQDPYNFDHELYDYNEEYHHHRSQDNKLAPAVLPRNNDGCFPLAIRLPSFLRKRPNSFSTFNNNNDDNDFGIGNNQQAGRFGGITDKYDEYFDSVDDHQMSDNDGDDDHYNDYCSDRGASTKINKKRDDPDTRGPYLSFRRHFNWSKSSTKATKKNITSSTATAASSTSSSSSSLTLESCWQTTEMWKASSFEDDDINHNGDSNNDGDDPPMSVSSMMYCNGKKNMSTPYSYTKEELEMVDGTEPTIESDLRPPRRYYVITTATLPWMTGTAVNPLLRAAYLSRRNRSLIVQQQQQQRNHKDQQEQQQQQHCNSAGTEGNTNNHTTDDISSADDVIHTRVTLVVPWLSDAKDRQQLYGPEWTNKTPHDQELYIRSWLSNAARMPDEASPPSQGGIEIIFYPARYHSALSSIFALGDLCEMIIPTTTTESDRNNESKVDDSLTTQSQPSSLSSSGNIPTETRKKSRQKSDAVCILEEPEHVNFYRAPGIESWREKFSHVIGIVHTNYKAYVQNHYSGIVTGPLVGALSALMVQAYCDKVVKLSPVLQTYAPGKEIVQNVHGIRQEFFTVPTYSAVTNPSSGRQGSNVKPSCYFIGKLLWAKGLDKLLSLQSYYRRTTGQYFDIDIIGSGPEEEQIKKSFLGTQRQKTEDETTGQDNGDKTIPKRQYWRYFRQPIPARFLGRRDHAVVGPNYKVFVNPSVTEVLCTTTVEAIAMAKWVIVPRHSSNEFMRQFPNCLQYRNKSEFCDLLQYALSHSVEDVIPELSHMDRSQIYAPLTWGAATERLVDTGYLSKRDARRRDRLDKPKDRSIQEWHYALGNGKKGDVLRRVLGGGPVADQSPYKTSPSTLSLSSDM